MKTTNYSEIIKADEYNRIINDEHLYISDSDNFIFNFLKDKSDLCVLDVVELGCGPARLSQKLDLIKNLTLTGVDIDSTFLEFARDKKLKYNFINSDIATYKHPK